LAWSGRGGALVALLALGASVSAAGEERCSLAGGETWREYQNRQFVIDAAGWERAPARLVAAVEVVDSKRVGSLGVDAKQMKDRLTEMQKRCAAAQDPLTESLQ
jgi:hypothetical protein